MKNKREMVDYVIWGVLSMLLNVGLAQLMVSCGINYKIANAITLIVVKVFCYITNKLFVFRTPFGNMIRFLKELGAYILARGISFCVDFCLVIVLVDWLKQDFFVSKCLVSVLVVVLNYILNKCFVFRKKAGRERT